MILSATALVLGRYRPVDTASITSETLALCSDERVWTNRAAKLESCMESDALAAGTAWERALVVPAGWTSGALIWLPLIFILLPMNRCSSLLVLISARRARGD